MWDGRERPSHRISGMQVVVVDVAETALSIARQKAAGRGVDAEFVFADALHLDGLGRTFQTVLDSGCFTRSTTRMSDVRMQTTWRP